MNDPGSLAFEHCRGTYVRRDNQKLGSGNVCTEMHYLGLLRSLVFSNMRTTYVVRM